MAPSSGYIESDAHIGAGHDVVEIDAGESSGTTRRRDASGTEVAAAGLFGVLAHELSKRFPAWDEYEAGETAEARLRI